MTFLTSFRLSLLGDTLGHIDSFPVKSLPQTLSGYMCLTRYFLHDIPLLNSLLQFLMVHQIKALIPQWVFKPFNHVGGFGNPFIM